MRSERAKVSGMGVWAWGRGSKGGFLMMVPYMLAASADSSIS